MSRTAKIEVYTIDELSDSAKEKAHEQYCNSDYDYSGDNEETLKKFEEMLPIKIKEWEYDTYDGRFRFTFEDQFGASIKYLHGPRLMAYLYNNCFEHLFPGKIYWGNGKDASGNTKRRRSRILRTVNECPLTGYYMDNVILEPIYKFLNEMEDINFHDLISRCLSNWIDACVDDCKDFYSMERFVEISSDNGWEYYENGKQFY